MRRNHFGQMAKMTIEVILMALLVIDLLFEGGSMAIVLFALYIFIHRPGGKAGMGLGLLLWARMII